MTKSTPFEKMKYSFFRVASFSFVARQSPRPGLSSAGPGFRCANSFAHLQVGVANPSTGPSPGTLGELLNRPPRPEGRRGYGAQIFDFSAPSRAKALPHYSPSLVGLKPSLICCLWQRPENDRGSGHLGRSSVRQSRPCGFQRPRFARLEVRKRCLRTETPARRRPRPG